MQQLMNSSHKSWLFHGEQCTRALFMDSQIPLFSNFFIKNGSQGTIHTFKNYFNTAFSVSAKISSIQTDSQFSVSIIQIVWVPRMSICLDEFWIIISVTQFSDFWVTSYENWKNILGVFSFQNSVFNGIFVIKLTYQLDFFFGETQQQYLTNSLILLLLLLLLLLFF